MRSPNSAGHLVFIEPSWSSGWASSRASVSSTWGWRPMTPRTIRGRRRSPSPRS